jgi:hypothetical protein
MKNIYIVFLIAVSSAVSAQNLTGKTITLVAADSMTLIETGPVTTYNKSSQSYSIMVRRREESLVPNTANYFCWTQCYSPNTDSSSAPLTIAANGNNTDFHAYYDPAGYNGESTVRYVFYNPSDRRDSVWTRIVYKTTGTGDTLTDPFMEINFVAGVKENRSANISNAYPNPAKDQVTFIVRNNEDIENIEVVNLLGVTVLKQSVNSDRIHVPVTELSEGVYFCNFYKDGVAVSTQRFTVQK